MEILFLRDDDIPQYVEQGVADLGILGENEVWEKDKDVDVVEQLGFGNCRLSLAIPKEEEYTGISYFQGKKSLRVIRKYCSNISPKKASTLKSKKLAEALKLQPASDLPTAFSIL